MENSPPSDGRPNGLRRHGGTIVAVVVIVLWLALAGIGGPKIGQLASVQSNDEISSLPADAESVRAGELSADFAQSEALPAIVVFTAPAPSAEQVAGWQAFAAGVPDVPVRGGTVADYLAPAPVVPIPSPDGQALLAVVPISLTSVESDDTGEQPLLAVVEALRAAAGEAAGPGAQSHVTGPAGLIADLSTAFEGIDGLLLLVALLTVLVILLLVYRAVVLPLLVLFNSIFALAAAGGVVYWLASSELITLNGQSQGILFILTVGAATDYGLLLVARYREELTRHERPRHAVAAAWRGTVAPILASAGTVIAGLLCLLLSSLSANRSLGPVGALGVAAAALAALTLLPALLLGGRWLFWPKVPRLPQLSAIDKRVVHAADSSRSHGRHERAEGDRDTPSRAVATMAAESAEAAERADDAGRDGAGPGGATGLAAAGAGASGPPRGRHSRDDSPDGEYRLWGAVARFVDRRPRQIWIITTAVLLAGCAALPTLRASGTTAAEAFLNPADSVTGQEALAEHFTGSVGDPVIVITAADGSDAVIGALTALPSVDSATVTVDRQTREPVVVDGQVQIEAAVASAADPRDAVRDIRGSVGQVAPGSVVGGSVAQQVDLTDIARDDLAVIFPAVLLVVLLVLIALLRSITAPVLLIGATVLSFGAALGISALVFNHVFDFPGSDPAVPLFAFVFLVALGVDYSIFLMSRAREEVLLSGPRQGVLDALRVTGGVITSAGIVLAATFAALSVIPLIFLVQIAFIVSFGVLLDTFVVRTLLVPALALELGRRAWWPSRLSAAG